LLSAPLTGWVNTSSDRHAPLQLYVSRVCCGAVMMTICLTASININVCQVSHAVDRILRMPALCRALEMSCRLESSSYITRLLSKGGPVYSLSSPAHCAPSHAMPAIVPLDNFIGAAFIGFTFSAM
jgi:hypothetical protein